jgi:hypothetical protein
MKLNLNNSFDSLGIILCVHVVLVLEHSSLPPLAPKHDLCVMVDVVVSTWLC